MKKIEQEIANALLQIKAIKLQPAKPFTWASGWKSPIYCDNRKTLYYPEVRKLIQESFVKMINDIFPKPDVIAGVATGAIAIGILVAEALDLPFIYVRSAPKGHGMENMIEGEVVPGKKVLIIEDLVSTGKSSLKAAEALRHSDMDVLGMCAIFTYGFKVAEDNFKQANISLHTLSNYSSMIEKAVESGYVQESDLETLQQWRTAPDQWG